jgi:hypothetical protein
VDDKPRKPKEAIQLSLNYEDPFLKTVGANHHAAHINDESKTRKKIQPVKSSPTKPIPPPPAPIKWPELTFKGIIQNKKKGEVLGIISINGSDRIIKTNDPMGDFIIESIRKDQILVKHLEGETKVYARK